MGNKKHVPPSLEQRVFTCVFCEMITQQTWGLTWSDFAETFSLYTSTCTHCSGRAFWFRVKQQGDLSWLIYPRDHSLMPLPHEDLPEDCKVDYEEARAIAARSPRGAAALLRLVVQKLMKHLGESGTDINNDIGSLVKKGLPREIQQALDLCRVVGNEAVHPGTLDLNTTPELGLKLFKAVNYIVEDRITRPRELEADFNGLPADKLKGIENRDKKSKSPEA